MIIVFVNENGYYIVGSDIEKAFYCSPALSVEGNRIFPPLHHLYKVIYIALNNLCNITNMNGDIIVYNDSRIIDELNGTISPLDESCIDWRNIIRRYVLPTIKGNVLFRKKSDQYINTNIKIGQDKMIKSIGPQEKARLVELEEAKIITNQDKQKVSIISKFKAACKPLWRKI